jgi:hypothetical protein
VALPAWLAWTVHVPTAISLIVAPFFPLEVQITGVVVVKVTVKPDEAVALTATGDWVNRLFARAENAID